MRAMKSWHMLMCWVFLEAGRIVCGAVDLGPSSCSYEPNGVFVVPNCAKPMRLADSVCLRLSLANNLFNVMTRTPAPSRLVVPQLALGRQRRRVSHVTAVVVVRPGGACIAAQASNLVFLARWERFSQSRESLSVTIAPTTSTQPFLALPALTTVASIAMGSQQQQPPQRPKPVPFPPSSSLLVPSSSREN
eukprot:766727-Hanusia_phi.AAC.1